MGEVDCSRKMCPKGNDVLDTRMDTTDTMLYQVQNISFNFQADEQYESVNETYTTIPIKLYLMNPQLTCSGIEAALKSLPNGVIDDVKVNSTTPDVTQGFDVSFLVYFTGTSVQGPQNLLMVDTALCGDGCTPKLSGVDVKSFGDELSYVTEAIAAD